jgi:hypothetical protein
VTIPYNVSKKILVVVLFFSVESNAQDEAQEFPLPRRQVIVGLARNHPTSFSLRTYKSGNIQPYFEYLFLSRPNWLVSLGAGYKAFVTKDDVVDPLLSVRQSFSYLIRLDYNMHVGLGVEWLYLTPTKEVGLLPQRKDDRESEVGAGAFVKVIHQMDERFGLNIQVSRWRGTATMELHGFEMGVGLIYFWK